MFIEKSFVNNYVYKKSGDEMVGGYPVHLLTDKSMDAKFENMSIPAGLVVDTRPNSLSLHGGKKHRNVGQHELIGDELFDHLISAVSFHTAKHNSTKRIIHSSSNKTKKK
jgi:hypothetical protein